MSGMCVRGSSRLLQIGRRLCFAGTFHEAAERTPIDLVEILLDESVEYAPVDLIKVLLDEPVQHAAVNLVEVSLLTTERHATANRTNINNHSIYFYKYPIMNNRTSYAGLIKFVEK